MVNGRGELSNSLIGKQRIQKMTKHQLGLPSIRILFILLHAARHLKAASDRNGEFNIETFFKVRHSDVNA